MLSLRNPDVRPLLRNDHSRETKSFDERSPTDRTRRYHLRISQTHVPQIPTFSRNCGNKIIFKSRKHVFGPFAISWTPQTHKASFFPVDRLHRPPPPTSPQSNILSFTTPPTSSQLILIPPMQSNKHLVKSASENSQIQSENSLAKKIVPQYLIPRSELADRLSAVRNKLPVD